MAMLLLSLLLGLAASATLANEEPPYTASLFHVDSPASPLRRNASSGVALWADRLARDALRVKSMRPASLNASGSALLTSGAALHGSGEYFIRLGVGTPPKEFYLTMDTGSDITWLQCKPCVACYKQLDPLLDPSASASMRKVPCASSLCKQSKSTNCITNAVCSYQAFYGDGSFTRGNLVSDVFSVGHGNLLGKLAFGCGHHNVGLFEGSAGLLGLGTGSLSLPSQLGNSPFSYCLPYMFSSTPSTLTFNKPPASSGFTAPLLRNPHVPSFYFVSLEGISVAGSRLPIKPELLQMNAHSGDGGFVIDSGTTITQLQAEVYDTVFGAFQKAVRKSRTVLRPAPTFDVFNACFFTEQRDRLSPAEARAVPSVVLHFAGGHDLMLPADNILASFGAQRQKAPSVACLAFVPNIESFSVLGNVQQQSFRFTFDSHNARITFDGPGRC